MLVTADGRRWGTVGGGCVEADVAQQALEAAERGEPSFVRHTLNADVAGDIGLSCGGTAEFFLEPLVTSRSMAELYGAVARCIGQRRPALVYTATDWTQGPRKAACLGDDVVSIGELELPSLDREVGGRNATAFFDEEASVFVEPLERMPRVVVFGAGHVGMEIARVAGAAGFHVVIVDDREEFANAERIPWADEILVENFRAVLDRMTFDEDDFVLATTRGHSFDAYIVERAAGSRARYVGMLGSKRKRAVIMRALEAAGVSKDDLKRVKTPIGVDIGADTPAEIGVSVVAELIRLRRLEDRTEKQDVADRAHGPRARRGQVS